MATFSEWYGLRWTYRGMISSIICFGCCEVIESREWDVGVEHRWSESETFWIRLLLKYDWAMAVEMRNDWGNMVWYRDGMITTTLLFTCFSVVRRWVSKKWYDMG